MHDVEAFIKTALDIKWEGRTTLVSISSNLDACLELCSASYVNSWTVSRLAHDDDVDAEAHQGCPR